MKWTATASTRWREFKSAPAGRRFEQFYEERKRARKHGSVLGRVAVFVLGILITASGVVFLAIPGPGLLVIALGLGLISSESLVMAKALDVAEVRVRTFAKAGKQFWQRLSMTQRMVGATSICALAAGVLAVVWMCFLHSPFSS